MPGSAHQGLQPRTPRHRRQSARVRRCPSKQPRPGRPCLRTAGRTRSAMDKCTRRTARHSLRNAANTPPRLPRRRKLAARRSVLAPSPLPGRPPPAQTARRRRPRQQQLCRTVRHPARRTARNTQLHNPTPTRGPSDAHAPARPRSYLRRRGKPDGSSLVEAAQLGAKCGAQCGGQHDTCTQRGGLPCVGRAAPPWPRSARGATTARPQRRRRA